MMTRHNTANTPVQQKPVNHNSQILKYSQHSSSKNAEGRGLTGQRQKNKNLNLREESPATTDQAAATTTTTATNQQSGSDLRGKEQQQHGGGV